MSKEYPVSLRTTQGMTFVNVVFFDQNLTKNLQRKIIGKTMAACVKKPLELKETEKVISMHIRVEKTSRLNQKRYTFQSIIYIEGVTDYRHEEIKGEVTIYAKDLQDDVA